MKNWSSGSLMSFSMDGDGLGRGVGVVLIEFEFILERRPLPIFPPTWTSPPEPMGFVLLVLFVGLMAFISS